MKYDISIIKTCSKSEPKQKSLALLCDQELGYKATALKLWFMKPLWCHHLQIPRSNPRHCQLIQSIKHSGSLESAICVWTNPSVILICAKVWEPLVCDIILIDIMSVLRQSGIILQATMSLSNYAYFKFQDSRRKPIYKKWCWVFGHHKRFLYCGKKFWCCGTEFHNSECKPHWKTCFNIYIAEMNVYVCIHKSILTFISFSLLLCILFSISLKTLSV